MIIINNGIDVLEIIVMQLKRMFISEGCFKQFKKYLHWKQRYGKR